MIRSPQGIKARLKTVGTYALSKLTPQVFNGVISMLAINWSGAAFWGEFAVYLITMNLIQRVLAWGNADYLLRLFSRSPHQIHFEWISNIFVRGLICVPIGILIFIIFRENQLSIWVLGWGVSLFIFRSYDVVILYEKKYALPLIIDFTGYSLLLIYLFANRSNLEIVYLLIGYTTLNLVKSLALGGYYRSYWSKLPSVKVGMQSLSDSTIFFIPSLTAFIQSRIDLYTMGILMNPTMLGQYQVFTSLLNVVNGLITYIVNPFVKNIYRLNRISVFKVKKQLALYGVSTIVISMAGIYFVMIKLYKIELAGLVYLAAFLKLIPFSFYLISIIEYFKYDLAKRVITITIILGIVNTGLCLLLIPAYGILGAILASAIVEWLVLLCYQTDVRRIKKNAH